MKLQKADIKISGRICKWFRKEVKFLGFIISNEGIRSYPVNTEPIRLLPTASSQKALQ
jgi:hypothetical protein